MLTLLRLVPRGLREPAAKRDSGGYGAAGSMGDAEADSGQTVLPQKARHTITGERTRPVTAPRSAAGTPGPVPHRPAARRCVAERRMCPAGATS